jgi:hypothetical protein
MAERAIDRAIAAVADRSPVDWDALAKEAWSEEDLSLLNCLRVLGGIASLHQATADHVDVPRDDPDAAARQPPVAGAAESQWGRYRLRERVGEGGFGSVHRAWDPELEFEVALKILHRRVADGRLKDALLREGRALAKVRHPHIVKVLGVEFQEDRIALCMEFVHGETLEDVLQRGGTMDPRQAALICQDICRALAAVHLSGFVHLDVKARNVMQERGGRIVLMDFGAGQEADQLKLTGRTNMVGTPLYMAPEVLAGQSATPSSDVYSVGVLLYHLVTAEYPVEGQTVDDIRAAYMQGRRRLLSERRPELPVSFLRVVDRALAADPSRRYATAGQFLEALVEVVDDVKLKPRSRILEFLQRFVPAAVTGVAVAFVLGFFNSLEFNHMLGRSEFVDETPLDWIWWGSRSCIGTALTLMLIILTASLLVVVRRLLLTASERVRLLEARLLARLGPIVRWLRYDDASVSASLALLLAASLLVGAWWYFAPLLGALLGYVPTAAASSLELLSPANRPYHELYRKTFTGVLICAGVLWYAVSRLSARKRDLFHRGISAGAAAVFCLALLYLDFPFRVFYQNKFKVARWQGAECYVLGERRDEVLLFCPESQPSRNTTIKKGAVGFEDLNREDDIFSHFQKPPASPAAADR